MIIFILILLVFFIFSNLLRAIMSLLICISGYYLWSSITNSEQKSRNIFSEENYYWINESPNELQIRKMLGLLAQEQIEFIMTNHTYIVGCQIYLQSSGGPIGIDFSRILDG